MRISLRIFLLTLLVAVLPIAGNLAAQPPKGSQLPPDENSCAQCHGEADLWEDDTLRLHVPQEGLANDVHFQKGVNCHDCHGGDPGSFDVPEAHAVQVGEDAEGVLPFGSPLSEVKKSCAKCHQEHWDKVAAGAHANAGEANAKGADTLLGCGTCHGENVHGIRAVADPESPVNPTRLLESCGSCHKEQQTSLKKGMHAKAGEKAEDGSGTLMACATCHGDEVHGMLPVSDADSPVFLDHQVQKCGGCHQKDWDSYKQSVHGRGLYESGLLVTAVCADCHGAHGIYLPADERSTLHRTKVASTCAKCHRFIEERLQESVHGQGKELGTLGREVAWGGTTKEKPSCTRCHQGHDLPDPKSIEFRLELPFRCGNCHVDLSKRYAMSMHGQLTEIGYGPAAKCADCHGAHDILPISNPKSRLAAGENRLQTCKKCHLYAVQNFSEFHPHADHKDAQQHPVLHAVYLFMEILLYSVFGFFGLHTFLWFLRSLIHTLAHGRPKRLQPRQPAYQRFQLIHRVLHVVMIVSFLGLALTGLPLKYGNQPWGKGLARAMGGFDSTSIWHHVCAVLTVFYFTAHLVWMAEKVFELKMLKVKWMTILFGPDSPIPNFRDIQDFLRMIRWFFGLGPKPTFERWSYWEKFDYWAVFWGVGIIGTSGLMLWFPNVFSRFLPGDAINIAKVIHSEEALLATGFIFAIHFFNTHLRAEKFPIDVSILTGMVTEEELREERPDYLERMRRAGRLEQARRIAPTRSTFWLITLGGFLALAVGLCLLAGMILAGLGG